MRSLRARAVLATAMLLAALGGCTPAYAFDSLRSLGAPGNALVAPFDARPGKTSFLVVSNVSQHQITTHWAFWSDTCTHLADVSMCLTAEDTVTVDPNTVQAIGADNSPLGPVVTAASGHAGFVTVTAYQTNDGCEDALRSGQVLVDDALVGNATLADTATTASFGIQPLVLGLDELGTHTDLPDVQTVEVDVDTFSPGSLQAAVLYAFALEENSGDFAGEVGALSGQVTATVAFFDNMEIRTSLPDLTFGCAAVLDVLGLLEPLQGATSGLLRLSDVAVLRNGGSSQDVLGGRTGAYGVLGEALGPFGAVFAPSFKTTSLFD